MKKKLSIATWTCFFSFLTAFLLTLIDARLAVIPLSGFVLVSLMAPFFPGCSYYMPVISRGNSGKKAVALTFDDGPDPYTTPPLLALLERYNARATFFVTGAKAAAGPDLIRDILARGHCIGNHTCSHDNFIMLKNTRTIMNEIGETQSVLGRFAVRVHVFRPPVGITSPRTKNILMKYGMCNVGFSCRGNDFGNRRIKGLAGRILGRVKADDIIMLHDVMPPKKECLNSWLNEIDLVLAGIIKKGLVILPLSELIGRPVMTRINSGKE
jgi:peptidoglycan/xylan/chitin deacetylase (PgdA/CDA1 family)